MSERDEWQPISTAPTDGTWLLTFNLGAAIPWVLRWNEHIGAWSDDDADHDAAAAWDGIPTHWRPLPPPPKGDGE